MKLRELIELYNFRYLNENVISNSKQEDTTNIRIYNINDDHPNMNWIEIGQYDFSNNSPLIKILNTDYLNSTVKSINVDPELYNLHVWVDMSK